MAWIIPHGSGGSFVNMTGRLSNPRTAAQNRAAYGTGDNKGVLVYGVVQVAIAAATTEDSITVVPTTTLAAVRLTYNGGDLVPDNTNVDVVNPLQQSFSIETTILLERRDNKFTVIAGFPRSANVLHPTAVKTANYVASVGDLVLCDASSGSFEIGLRAEISTGYISHVGDEVGVLLLNVASGNGVTISMTGAAGTLTMDVLDKSGNGLDEIVLRRKYEYVRFKFVRSPGGTDDQWLIVDDERFLYHDLAYTPEKTATYTAIPGDLVRVSTSGASRTVNLPDGAPVDSEIAVVLSASAVANKCTVTATGSGASIVGGSLPVVSSVSVELFAVGDIARFKHVGSNVWNVVGANVRSRTNHGVTAVKTTTYTAVPGETVLASTSGGSWTLSLPADTEAGTEVAAVLTAFSATTKLTITATGTGASITASRLPVISSVSVELFLVGDEVRLKHIGGNDWVVVDSHVMPHHAEILGSTSAGQTFTHNTVATALMETATYDNAGLADLANDRIVFRRSGRYQVTAGLGISTGGLMTRLLVTVRNSGSGSRNWSTHPNTTNAIQYAFAPFTMTFAVGDQLDLRVTQTSSDSSSRTAGIDATQAPMISVQEIL